MQKSCTCKQYDLEKIPCEHAIKAALSRNIEEETLVEDSYTKNYVYAAWSKAFNPRDEDLIPPPEVLSETCLPPIVKILYGRRNVKRYKSAIEKVKRYKRHQFLKKECKKMKINPTVLAQKLAKKRPPSTHTRSSRQSHKKKRENYASYSIPND